MTDYVVDKATMDTAGGGSGFGRPGHWVWCNTYYFTKPAILYLLPNFSIKFFLCGS